ncbi:uncharacterized protein LOC132732013 [Ruditapes philippinarum]|uniref:uncharacterized protein LOC132732013 n=1 Tax=Ruditapes philippinarum TaxID=129788 RepID=UPI00295AE52A|nr:uncharacterized protein LOC132732013 [Ruditapes philippinarum]
MSAKTEKEDDVYAQLVKGVVTSVQLETLSEEAERIRSTIHFYLMAWLDEVEEINPLFKVKELIGVGSYAEGTKIIEPNEFDYLAVIDDFSKPGLLKIDLGESSVHEGLVKVKVEDDDLKSRCGQLCQSGHLQCFQPINFPMSGDNRFGHVFIEALFKYAKKNGKGGYPIITCQIDLPIVNNISLLLTEVDYNSPNVLICFKYKGKEITTDISPAIRYFRTEDCFKKEDCAGPVFAELVLSRKSLLLIGAFTRNDSDFKITVTEAEVEYMKTVMKAEHKTIYIFLKYITKLYKDKVYNVYPFTSYMLKSVCFHHDIKCEPGKRSIRHCFQLVIEDLMVCDQQGYVISIVNKHMHLVLNKDISLYKNIRRSNMLTDMKKMSILPQGINTVDAFHEYVRNFVLELKQIRDKEQDDTNKLNATMHRRFKEKIQREVSKLADMGFDADEAEIALKRALDDPELALAILRYDAERRAKNQIVESEIYHPKNRPPTSVQSNVPAVCCPSSVDTSLHLTQGSQSDTDTQHCSTTTVNEEDAERLTKTKTVESDVNHPNKCLPTFVQSNVPAVYCPSSVDKSLRSTQEYPRDTDIQHNSATMIKEEDAERLTKNKTVESDVNHPNKCLPTFVQSNVPAVYCPGSADTSLHLTQESPRDTDTQHSSTTMVTEEEIYERQKH